VRNWGFYWVGIKATNLSKGNLWKLMLLLSTLTAVASMFIDNVTTIRLMIPVTLSIVRILKVPPIPFILSQALVSNIGDSATLILVAAVELILRHPCGL
jgi:Na+/H+ antiporter NhaD/arsenite permease-like protein